MTWNWFGLTWTDFILRGTLVLAAAFAASYTLSRASAALRHLVWTSAFLALLAMPLTLSLAPKLPIAIGAPTPAAQPARAAAVSNTPAPTPPRAPQEPVRAGQYAFALYLAGFLAVAARFLSGAVRTSRVVRRARPAAYAQPLADTLRDTLAIGRTVRALETPAALVPMTWGTRRPVVLLPDAARHWPAERLHAVVLHEMIHVQRHDLPAQIAAQAACCLYWFHPLAWLAARQLRKERERACDDAVLSGGIAAPDYAGHLLAMARTLVDRRSLADAPAMAEACDLEARVRAVLSRGSNRSPLNRRLAATVAAFACALVLPVALVTVHAQAGTGALAGVVQDISKARVPGSAVSLKNLDGRNEEKARVNAAGEFGFASIPAGHYAVEVRSPGFAIGKTEVLVEAGRRATVVVTLNLGQISESMTVRGARPATGSLAPPAPSAAPSRTPQRIPIGGNVQPAKLLTRVPPVYPAGLKAQGITGTVMIRAVISITGEPLNPEVINTTVHAGLAQAALEAVRQWRYQPTLLNGQPVEVPTTVDVIFELDQ